MNAVSIGPFVLSSTRFAALLAILAFVLASSVFARRMDPVIGRWSNWALIGGLIAARLGHVGLHWRNFAAEPWRVLAAWQGGFDPIGGLLGVLIVSAFFVRSMKTGLAVAATLGISLLIGVGAAQLTKTTLGQLAPHISLPQLDGPPITVSDLAGKPAVINLWASWCPPCRREMPLMAEVAARRSEVAFLFINQGEGPETIRSYLASGKIKLDHVLLDRFMQVPRHYTAVGLPITLFLRADGTLAAMHMGEISREILDDNIEKLANPT